MPRNVRNFWIEAEVDGRKTPIAFGPRGKDGGFRLTVFIRNKGEVERVVNIEGRQSGENGLLLEVDCEGGWQTLLNRASPQTGKWQKLLAIVRKR